MKVGVVYPQVELGGDTGAVKAFAQLDAEVLTLTLPKAKEALLRRISIG